jgi:response regulator RpfG family c-di-GMP phosphodiesterase
MKRLKSNPGTPTTLPGPTEVPVRFTVVVVDDEPANVNVLERILDADYDVLKALSGSDALALVRTRSGDDLLAVLSDQRMPGMTGVELLATVAQERPDVSRILITGYSDMEAIVAAINVAQVMHYVSKPYTPDTIRQVVRRAVDERARRQTMREELETLRRHNRALQHALEERTRHE